MPLHILFLHLEHSCALALPFLITQQAPWTVFRGHFLQLLHDTSSSSGLPRHHLWASKMTLQYCLQLAGLRALWEHKRTSLSMLCTEHLNDRMERGENTEVWMSHMSGNTRSSLGNSSMSSLAATVLKAVSLSPFYSSATWSWFAQWCTGSGRVQIWTQAWFDSSVWWFLFTTQMAWVIDNEQWYKAVRGTRAWTADGSGFEF